LAPLGPAGTASSGDALANAVGEGEAAEAQRERAQAAAGHARHLVGFDL